MLFPQAKRRSLESKVLEGRCKENKTYLTSPAISCLRQDATGDLETLTN